MPFYDHDSLGQKSSHPQGTLWLGESTWQIHGRKTRSEIFRASPSKDVSFPPSTKQCLEWQISQPCVQWGFPPMLGHGYWEKKHPLMELQMHPRGIRAPPTGASSLSPTPGGHAHHFYAPQSLAWNFFSQLFDPFPNMTPNTLITLETNKQFPIYLISV